MKNLLYIGNKLSKHGVTPTTIEILGPLLELEAFRVSYSSSHGNKLLRVIDMLWSVFQSRKADCVLIDVYSTTNFWYAFAVSQLCRCLNLKYIPILHGGNLASRLKNNPKICRMIFKHSFQNVAPSFFLMQKFKDAGYENVMYIPNSIELENYPFLERKKAKPNLLWVRSFAKIYNPMMAVEVFASIKKKYPEATLCMVGPEKDGSLSEVRQRAKELKLDILFTGKLSKNDWINKSKEYDIFINTTHFDNMPVSVIEAMTLGLAIVSTNVGGIPFLLENQKDALLVPDGDVNRMIDAIDRLIGDSDLFSSITTNARRKAEQFDWQLVKVQWLTLLK
ncbi:glycosyltransferase family 4 protein [Flavobacterium gilvum]|uniref:Glycosyl transferase family 1 n=1 Tax=Flavobacterium gilvum TaxID=1492737 RepID=A0AAC9N4E6_9FLAO|nr:glycosyltransferase family 4 protein [Flavobacterium gilvum]AOW08111.1 glycosyl transferase family 1 [Flavobacterium gilvum]KFC58880.1 glycosyl transferase, group 1 family protein [Flavobacterium gilvum]